MMGEFLEQVSNDQVQDESGDDKDDKLACVI